jgi:hypothetical protein
MLRFLKAWYHGCYGVGGHAFERKDIIGKPWGNVIGTDYTCFLCGKKERHLSEPEDRAWKELSEYIAASWLADKCKENGK